MAQVTAESTSFYSDAVPVDSANFRWRLFYGQAIDVLGRMPDNHFDSIWTDPPYLLSNGGITCHAGRMVSVDKGDWDKSKGWEQDLEFTEEWMTECHRVLKPTGTIWVSGTLHFHPIAGIALIKSGFRLLKRHRVGETESTTKSRLSNIHPLNGTRLLGSQGKEG